MIGFASFLNVFGIRLGSTPRILSSKEMTEKNKMEKNMGLAGSYCKDTFKNIKYRATWLPNLPIKLGDFGRFDDNVFQKFGNIRDHGIQFTAELGVPTDNQEWQSAGANVSHFEIGMGGFINAGVQFTFGKKYDFYLLAANCQLSVMNSLAEVQATVKEMFRQKKFKDMHFVTEVLTAESSNVVISLDKNAELAIEAKDNTLSKLDLKVPNAAFDIKKNSKIGHTTIASQGLTPLFQTVKV